MTRVPQGAGADALLPEDLGLRSTYSGVVRNEGVKPI